MCYLLTMLTQRQETFRNLVFQGIIPFKAYEQAGFKVTTKHAAESNASRLLKNAEIQASLEELRKPAKKALIATRDELGEIYTIAVKGSKTNIRDKVLAGREISQLYGYYNQPPGQNVNIVFLIGKGYANQLKEGKGGH